MKLYFGGSEVPSHRKLLAEEHVPNVSLSYVGLRRKVQFVRPWTLEDHYPPEQRIFLDSGCYTLNKPGSTVTEQEALHLATAYMAFARASIDRVDMVAEFDAKILGPDWLESMRSEFYDGLGDKFLPIWHPEAGLNELGRLCEKYARVGILQGDLETDITSRLNSLVNQHGVKLHGVAMTKMAAMQDVQWDSVGSTSWISPTQYGDTFVWTGRELKRYPVKYKESSRKRHRTLFADNGFDTEKIANDDPREVLRLSIWSWTQFVEHISAGKSTVSSSSSAEDDVEVDLDNLEPGTAVVAHQDGSRGTKREIAVVQRQTQPLPVMGITRIESEEVDSAGNVQIKAKEVFTPRSESMRLCETCYIRDKCPGFEPNANCLYNIPITIETVEDIRNLQNGMITMQTQRVLFMQMVEQAEGGYADTNLSAEIDRLGRLIKQARDAEREGFSINISGSQKAAGGFITSLLGPAEGQRALALPEALRADDILEAEVVSDTHE